jgi:hypothetical protein
VTTAQRASVNNTDLSLSANVTLTVTSGGCSPAQPFQHQAAMDASGAAFPAAVCGKHARNIVIGAAINTRQDR